MKESRLTSNQKILLSLCERDLEESNPSSWTLSNSKVQQEEDGVVQFWRIKNYLQNQFSQTTYWSDDRWKVCLVAGGGAKKNRHQYCTDISGTIVYLRTLQGHSGRNFTDSPPQDNVVIQSGFFQHIYHMGCAFNLHSIVNNGLTPGGQNSSKRQTVLFPADPRDKGHQDPAKIDFIVPRRASQFVKDQHSVKHDRIQLSFKEHSKLSHSKNCEIEHWRSSV